MKILDLDMDYFLYEVHHNIPEGSDERPVEEIEGETVWASHLVREFLENNLGLSEEHKISGRIVKGHNEALFFWEELIVKGELAVPFEVVHVDSHADLGLGYASDDFIQNDVLAFPVETRRKIRNYDFDGRIKEIGIGDYLLWGIAYQYISKLTYCANPNIEPSDYCLDTMKDFEEDLCFSRGPVQNTIQLKHHPKMELPRTDFDEPYALKYLRECQKDPEVPFTIIPTVDDVKFNGDFDFVVMAQSPNYAPESADFIMDILRDYIVEI